MRFYISQLKDSKTDSSLLRLDLPAKYPNFLSGYSLGEFTYLCAFNSLLMITVKTFVFNDFQTNTYVVSNSQQQCVIIDCACQNVKEWQQLKDWLNKNQLKPVHVLLTHCHVDHVLGCHYLLNEYGIGYKTHPASKLFIDLASEFSSVLKLPLEKIFPPEAYINEGDSIQIPGLMLKVIYTPGHADGSVCFYSEQEGIIFSGDVLFKDSIGRSDLPTGNFEKLKTSILEKLFVLPDDTVVYPGHGPTTTIGYERRNNPFI